MTRAPSLCRPFVWFPGLMAMTTLAIDLVCVCVHRRVGASLRNRLGLPKEFVRRSIGGRHVISARVVCIDGFLVG